MANNPIQDRYKPPSNLVTDFDELKFSEIEDDEIFWLNNKNDWRENTAHRKLNEIIGSNTKTGEELTFGKHDIIYVKI